MKLLVRPILNKIQKNTIINSNQVTTSSDGACNATANICNTPMTSIENDLYYNGAYSNMRNARSLNMYDFTYVLRSQNMQHATIMMKPVNCRNFGLFDNLFKRKT